MADFEWLTEDEAIFPAKSGEDRLVMKRPPWLFHFLIILIIAMSAAALYALVVRRGKLAEEAIKADVQRTHELVLEAAESRDVALFTTFLSGADSRWLDVQQETVRRGRFDEASWLGIYLDREQPYRLDEVTLSPGLNEAVVIYTRWYEPQDLTGNSIPLQQIAIYRQSEGRWLLSSPTTEFWGNDGTFQADELTISYPQRDETYVLRIADNLVAGMPEICNSQPHRSCPDGWRLQVDLTDNPETIINPTTMTGSISALNLSLPTPSLIGMPIDIAGYNFLYENYRRVLQRRITAFISQSVGKPKP